MTNQDLSKNSVEMLCATLGGIGSCTGEDAIYQAIEALRSLYLVNDGLNQENELLSTRVGHDALAYIRLSNAWEMMRDLAASRIVALAGLQKDADRLAWLELHLFDGKWDGTIGRPKSWYMAGPYRHTMQLMQGNTLREAIDSAIASQVTATPVLPPISSAPSSQGTGSAMSGASVASQGEK